MFSTRVLLVIFSFLVAASVAQNYPCQWMFSPPRGWDSYDAFPVWSNPTGFNESMLLEQAAAISRYNTTGQFNMIVIDEGWAENEMAWMLDDYGRPTVNPMLFPSAANGQGFGPLVEKLQSEYGIALGLWIIKGIPKQAVEMNLPIYQSYPYVHARDIYIPDKVCGWHKDVYWVNASNPGGQAYYNSLIALYQSWGIKYIKIDCIFGERDTDPLEVAAITKAARLYGQGNMMISLSPGKGANLQEGNETGRLANVYRVTDDLWDCWTQDLILCPTGTSIINQTYTLHDWAPLLQGVQRLNGYISIPDPDMIPLGEIGLGVAQRHLSWITKPNMARYVYGLWTITKSPIILGGDMRNLSATLPFLDALYSNAELAAVSICSGAPTMAYFQDVVNSTRVAANQQPSSAAHGRFPILNQDEEASSGDGGVIVWSVPHGSILNAFYVGYFAFSTNSSASYTQSIALDSALLPFNETISILYNAFDILDTSAASTVISPFTGSKTVNVTVGANDAQMYLYLPFGSAHLYTRKEKAE